MAAASSAVTHSHGCHAAGTAYAAGAGATVAAATAEAISANVVTFIICPVWVAHPEALGYSGKYRPAGSLPIPTIARRAVSTRSENLDVFAVLDGRPFEARAGAPQPGAALMRFRRARSRSGATGPGA